MFKGEKKKVDWKMDVSKPTYPANDYCATSPHLQNLVWLLCAGKDIRLEVWGFFVLSMTLQCYVIRCS